MADRLADLSRAGVSIWLDDLSRERLTGGSLASLVARDHVVGVTTNPTIFAKAISAGGEGYAGQLPDPLGAGTCVHEGLRGLATDDEVIDAFADGLERARQAGHDLAQIASVASFFVSRVDTEVDARLDKIGTAEAAALRGRAAIANARLAYQHYERMLASPRWAALAAAGARPQRPLWASTSVKDPAYSDTMYVTKLVAPDVVNTMPEATLRAVADHGEVPADSVRAHYSDARPVLTQLAAVRVDYDDVTAGLEQRGLELFDASWRELSDQLAAKLRNPCHS